MKIFDATFFTNKPTLPCTPIANVHQSLIYTFGMLDEAKLKPHISNNELVFIDIEGSIATPDELVKVARSADQNGLSRFGFYGYPIRPNNLDDYPGWLAKNEPYKPLLRSVDAIFPSLYCVTNKLDVWSGMLRNAIDYAREAAPGIPVYPFLWWKYHNGYTAEKNQYVGDSFWQFQLNQCRRYADGAVIWGGGGEWDDNASWWKILQHYL